MFSWRRSLRVRLERPFVLTLPSVNTGLSICRVQVSPGAATSAIRTNQEFRSACQSMQYQVVMRCESPLLNVTPAFGLEARTSLVIHAEQVAGTGPARAVRSGQQAAATPTPNQTAPTPQPTNKYPSPHAADAPRSRSRHRLRCHRPPHRNGRRDTPCSGLSGAARPT